MAEPWPCRVRGDLLLDQVLGERCARHYVRVLSSSSTEFAAMQAAMDDVPPSRGRPGMLIREGTGPVECSSSQVLARSPEVIWDVCGYYRTLGFTWREYGHLTRTQLRRRWLELDPSGCDLALAYAAQQLLDPVVRRAYDLMPLGGLFIGDREVGGRIERMAAMEASRRNAEAAFSGGDGTDLGGILEEWGLAKVPGAQARDQLAQRQPPAGPGALGETITSWAWGYYRLLTPGGPVAPADPARLERWQALLCAAFTARGLTTRFAVGICSGHGPVVWPDSNQGCIILAGSEITQEMARRAVAGVDAQETEAGR